MLGNGFYFQRSWHKAAAREKALRFYIQKLVIHRNYEDDSIENLNIVNQLKVKPFVSLMFFGSNKDDHHSSFNESIEMDLDSKSEF